MKKSLTNSELRYCQLRAEGRLPKYKCYLEAFTTDNPKTASTQSLRLEKCAEVRAEIARLQKQSETERALSRQEKREFLARAVRADIKNMKAEDHDLIDSITHFYSKDGAILRTIVKLPSKLECIKIDNLMAGDNEPEERNINFGGGVMLVPTVPGETLEDWETVATEQQAALKAN